MKPKNVDVVFISPRPMKKYAFLICLIFSTCFADNFSSEATFETCFTPGQNCRQLLIDEVNSAKKQILIESYVFTDNVFARSLVLAKRRGVDVKILIDAGQLEVDQYIINYLVKNNVYLNVDYRPAIAHNKIIIIDSVSTITGSYNYTRSAQEKNAENIIIIKDQNVTKKYIDNWKRRDDESATIDKYLKNFRKTSNEQKIRD